jgi:omega-hydroxy-beta-dihydromenaquinone-9 sulfotransferase
MKLSFLYGLRASDWWSLLSETGFDVDLRGLPSAALITLFSLQNSWLARNDARIDLSTVRVVPPIFLLGHWRSGTTHLHNLLAIDPALVAPNTYECAYPWSFLTSEDTHGKALERFAPRSRPQDNMAFSLWTPQEDELALTVLSRRTPFLAWAFPRLEERYVRYLTFGEAPAEDRAAFDGAIQLFVRKLSHRYPGRRPVLKSPGHTARIRQLLTLYPDARFVHIARDPALVYQSSLHLYRSWESAFAFLQRPDTSGMSERVLDLYETMYRAYLAERTLIPPGRLHELRFEDLEADPLAEMEKLYRALDLAPFPREELAAYVGTIAGYQRNAYTGLDAAIRQRVVERWRFAFEAFGYAT